MSVVSTSISHLSTPQRGKRDVSVTFSKCQVWREEERIRKEREEADWGDLSMYSLHNLYIYPGETESAFYQKQTCRFTLILHTQELHNTSQDFLRTVSFSLLCGRNWGLNYLFKGILSFTACAGFKLAALVTSKTVWTLGYHYPCATVACHFALIVSLRPGHNVSIKIMSIEKSFLVFTFKLQHAFTRSAVFHVEWPILMQTQSLGIQTGPSYVRGSQGKEWENEEGRGMEGETRREGGRRWLKDCD